MLTLQHVLQALIAAPEREYAGLAIMFAAQKSSQLGYASDKLTHGEIARIMLVQARNTSISAAVATCSAGASGWTSAAD